jgi:hypothetical protein
MNYDVKEEESKCDVLSNKQFKESCSNIYFVSIKTVKKEETLFKKKFVNEWFDDPYRKTYNNIVFDPSYINNIESDDYNLFSGFNVNDIKEYEEVDIEPIFKLINQLTDDNSDYFIKWLAHLFQKPAELTGTTPILISNQGAGKDTFIQFLTKMLSDKYIHTDANAEHILGNFNKSLQGKFVVSLNEACGNDTFKLNAKLKDIITAKYLNIEAKGKDVLRIRNYCRFILNTNEDVPINLNEKKERRFFIYKCNSALGENFFNNFYNNIMNNKNYHKCFYNYLMNVDLSNVSWINDRPINETYNEIKQLTASNDIQFLNYLCFEKFVDENNDELENGDLKERTLKFYKRYCSFCDKFKYNPIKYVKFRNIIMNKYNEFSTVTYPKNVSTIKFNVENCRKWLLDNKYYSFDTTEEENNNINE